MAHHILRLPLALLLTSTAVVPANAAIVTLNSGGADRGAFYSSIAYGLVGGDGKVLNNSYQIGHLGDGAASNLATAGYFIFDLSSVAGNTINSATLRIYHPSNSYNSTDPSETVTLFDVSTSHSILRTSLPGPLDLTALDAVVADLSGGTSYGSFTATLTDNSTYESTALNAAALTALNLAIGGEWAVGGAVTTNGLTGLGVRERIFRGSVVSSPVTELVLDLTPVPVPAAVWLFGSSLVALGVARRRTTPG